jgi:hypothetical protein
MLRNILKKQTILVRFGINFYKITIMILTVNVNGIMASLNTHKNSIFWI